jgi:hypothetical protein
MILKFREQSKTKRQAEVKAEVEADFQTKTSAQLLSAKVQKSQS